MPRKLKESRFIWEPDILNGLLEKTGLSQSQFSKACGISEQSVGAYCRGDTSPGLEAIIRMADALAVPVDVLLGRCKEEQANDILEHYPDCFQKLRRGQYEDYILHKRVDDVYADGFEAAWPYNLVDKIMDEPTEHILTEDEEAGLEKAISMLTEREQKFVYMRYRDEMTLSEMSRKVHLTNERIRQVIAKAIRKLRHPMRTKLIRYGVQGNQLMNDILHKEAELKQWCSGLDAREKRIQEAEEKLKLGTFDEKDHISTPDDDKPRNRYYASDAFMSLDLSVRSYNCLLRAGLNTVEKVCEKLKSGKMLEVRNLGRKSLEEIVKKVSDYTGEDYREFLYTGYPSVTTGKE